MTDKASFVRQAKRLRWMIIGFVSVLFISTFVYPPAMIIAYAALPVLLMVLLRLRCWNCGEQLMKNGGVHIEMCRTSRFKMEMCRHKTCGASLH